MKLRLGYPNRIVEVDEKHVMVFNGKLFSVPLDEVVLYYRDGNGLLPPAVREVADDVILALLRTGRLGERAVSPGSSGQSIAS